MQSPKPKGVTPFDVEAVRAQFPVLAEPDFHYLDNAATSQMPDDVLDVQRDFDARCRANVHGRVHRLARLAVDAYEGARAAVAGYINAPDPDEVIFTYGTTSSINLAAHAFGALLEPGDEIVLSMLEHHSNLLPWQQLAARSGVALKFIPVTQEGRMDLDRLDAVVSDRCRLIAVTHCSNVTGAETDTETIAQAAQSVGARLLLDGAQRLPHGPVDVQAMRADFYAFSGHKVFGPTGIGALWGRRELLERMPPFMVGGQMIEKVTFATATFTDPPRRFEAGTPPIGGAVGLGAAVRWAGQFDWAQVHEHGRTLMEQALGGLSALRGVRIVGPQTTDLRRGVFSFCMEGVDTGLIGAELDKRGIAIRCGYHCAQPLLAEMGAGAVARASLALYNTRADIEAFLEAVEDSSKNSGR